MAEKHQATGASPSVTLPQVCVSRKPKADELTDKFDSPSQKSPTRSRVGDSSELPQVASERHHTRTPGSQATSRVSTDEFFSPTASLQVQEHEKYGRDKDMDELDMDDAEAIAFKSIFSSCRESEMSFNGRRRPLEQHDDQLILPPKPKDDADLLLELPAWTGGGRRTESTWDDGEDRHSSRFSTARESVFDSPTARKPPRGRHLDVLRFGTNSSVTTSASSEARLTEPRFTEEVILRQPPASEITTRFHGRNRRMVGTGRANLPDWPVSSSVGRTSEGVDTSELFRTADDSEFKGLDLEELEEPKRQAWASMAPLSREEVVVRAPAQPKAKLSSRPAHGRPLSIEKEDI